MYHRHLVEYKGQRVLFPALEQTILDASRTLRHTIEFHVSGDGLQETALTWHGNDDDMHLAPKGMTTHNSLPQFCIGIAPSSSFD